ncbi:hypothetical protein HMPREF1420_01663 [Helicobacter pylori GAM264Ai]|nr:hypothetical protein HMPREF1420_01663 [Helicobacter pylori GAM264Ai]
MFASDVVIILIIFFGVSFILFGKEKNVKKDSKILDAIMNIIIRNYCCMHSLSLVTRVIILYIWFFSIACYSILNNFYFSQSHVYKLTI